MLQSILKKEFSSFFSNKGTLAVMFVLPLLLLLIFGFALGDYVKADYNTFENGTVFYLTEDNNPQMEEEFHKITEKITHATGVSFAEVQNEVLAQKQVEESLAYGLITLKEGGYSYFRSTFNEPQGGEMVRNLFVQLANQVSISSAETVMEKVVLDRPQIDSLGYYSFSSLAFSILFMGLIVGFSVQNEKIYGTIERIQLSKAGVSTIFITKLGAGVLCGFGQILTVYLFSSFVLKVNWGRYTGIIWLLFLLLSLYSAIFGGVMGFISKSKASCQNTVMMLSMLSGYFGGAISPLYLLENTSIMNIFVHFSPLYWFNTASISLQNEILDSSTRNAYLVLSGLICFWLAVLFFHLQKKSAVKKEPQKMGKAVRTS
ncbi:MAG: ABC transporter permease [Eubacteriales bacterium]